MKVSKLNRFGHLIFPILKNPMSLFKNIIQKSNEIYYKNKLIKKYQKDQLPTIDIGNLFPNFTEKLDVYSFLPGTASIPDLLLLKLLAKLFNNNCDYLEIGSWRGESAINMAPVANSITMITLGENEMKNKGFSPEFISQNEFFTKGRPEFKVIHADSCNFNFGSLNKKFDLIFIDGDHQYHSIHSDSKNAFSIIRNNSSIVVWHDYGYDPESVRYETLCAILDSMPEEKHCNLYHVSNTMSAIYIENYKGESHYQNSPFTPTNIFQIHVNSKLVRNN